MTLMAVGYMRSSMTPLIHQGMSSSVAMWLSSELPLLTRFWVVFSKVPGLPPNFLPGTPPCLQFMMFLLIFVRPHSEGFEVKVTEAINKRVPIIASDAGGIPLQVKEGKNGWIVPAGDSAAVSDMLYKIHKGELSVHRDISVEQELDGKSDPNSVAQEWVSVSTLPFTILLSK